MTQGSLKFEGYEKEMFIKVDEIKEGLVNKHQPDGHRVSNPVVFLGKIVNKDLLPKSIDEAIRDKKRMKQWKWYTNHPLKKV